MLWSRKLNVAMVDKSEGVECSGQLRRKCLGYVIFLVKKEAVIILQCLPLDRDAINVFHKGRKGEKG